MPDPSVSNRERLLRLIDGGPEVVKEVQEERVAPDEKKPVPVVPAAAAPDSPSAPSKIDPTKITWMVLVFALIVFVVHSLTGLFHPAGKTEKTTPASPAAVKEKERPSDLDAGLRLVGVDWSDAPVALLEDVKSGKTYFARKNDKIQGARVKEILKNKVVVIFRGKELELR